MDKSRTVNTNNVNNLEKPHSKKRFSFEEDQLLKRLVAKYGENWNVIASCMKKRNPRQCRERWINYLSGFYLQKPWTEEEDDKLSNLFQEYGSKWVKIASFFENRSDINVKNRWNMLVRREKKQKINEIVKKVSKGNRTKILLNPNQLEDSLGQNSQDQKIKNQDSDDQNSSQTILQENENSQNQNLGKTPSFNIFPDELEPTIFPYDDEITQLFPF